MFCGGLVLSMVALQTSVKKTIICVKWTLFPSTVTNSLCCILLTIIDIKLSPNLRLPVMVLLLHGITADTNGGD